MNYTEATKPGMGDPYWYEWSIGQKYILDMLNPDNQIKSVSLQENISLGLDDVVVKYIDNTALCIQIKHTRADDTITFGDIIASSGESDDKISNKSLLKELADSWYSEKDNYSKITPLIYTNRTAGVTPASAKFDDHGKKYKRPPLKEFWSIVKEQIGTAKLLSDIRMYDTVSDAPHDDWKDAWSIWCDELSSLPDEKDKIGFLRSLEIHTDKPSLAETELCLIDSLSSIFRINQNQSKSLLASLDHALRKWTTSNRERPEITIEDVYEALSLERPIKIFNHDLRPPIPFFESRNGFIEVLKNEILNGTKKVIFLEGVPGIGKTSVVSEMANNHETAIDIRYFAYEPFRVDFEYSTSDVSERVSPDVFWGELLAQLKNKLKGRLSKYDVPLRSDFLSISAKKSEFLRISNEFAKDRRRKFIIAVDGIDHAARAGVKTETFLETLIDPEYIPENIKFFISGQPIDAYPTYPIWLKNNSGNVKQFSVPQIEQDDIIKLLLTNENIKIQSQEINVLAKLIFDVAQGNTLSALFGVLEAQFCTNIKEIQSKLAQHKLSGNLSEYYNSIWLNAISAFNQYSFIQHKIAGVLSLINERTNPIMFQKIFCDCNISIFDWTNILNALNPLVTKDNNGYRILHNDVRLFFNRIASIDNQNIRMIADYISTYYKNLVQPQLPYYKDIFAFLEFAGRNNEIVELFSPQYVYRGYVLGLSIYELKNQGKQVLTIITQSDCFDWDLLHQVSCALITVNRIEESCEYTKNFTINYDMNPCTLFEYECFVIPKNEWAIRTLETVLSNVLELCEHNENERATGLFKRWFGNLSLTDIMKTISEKEIYSKHGNKVVISSDYYKLFNTFGVAACALDYDVIFDGLPEEKSNDLIKQATISLYDGYLQHALKGNTAISFASKLKAVKTFKYETYKKIIVDLLSEKRFLDLSLFIGRFSYNNKMPDEYKVYAISAHIACNIMDNLSDSKTNIINDLKNVNLKIDFIEEMTTYGLYAFTLGALEYAKDTENISNIVSNAYFANHTYVKDQRYGKVIFNLCAFIGKWVYCLNNFDIESVKVFVDIKKISTLFSAIFEKKWTYHQQINYSETIKKLILEVLMICADKTGDTHKIIVEGKLESLYSNFYVNYMFESGWSYFVQKKDYSKLKEWFDIYCGASGKIWLFELSERNQIAFEFLTLIEKYKLYHLIDTKYLKDKLSWSIIGYSQKDETAMFEPYEWLEEALKFDNGIWKDAGVKLIHLSNQISEIADNAVTIRLESLFVSSICKEGVAQFWDIYNNQDLFSIVKYNCHNIFSGIIGMLESENLSQEELLSIWAFGIGCLDWRNDIDQSYLSDLKKAIIIASKRINIDITRELALLGKAESACISDPVRFILPPYWFRDFEERELKEIGADNIEKEIAFFIQQIKNNSNFDESFYRLKSLIFSMRNLPPQTKQQYINEMLYSVTFADKNYYHLKDGNSFELIKCMAIELDDKELFAFIKYIIKLQSKDMRYLNYIAEDIATICKWVAQKDDKVKLLSGLNRMIDMNVMWLTGDKHFGDFHFNQIENTNIIYDYPSKWSEFSLEHLLHIIKTEDAERVECALKGIWALIKINPSNLEVLIRNWNSLHFRAQEWVLLILERCLNSKIGNTELIVNHLYSAAKSEYLNVMLYANQLLSKICNEDRLIGDIKFEKQDYFNEIESKNSGRRLLIHSHENQNITGMEAVESCLKRLKAVTGDNCDDIESTVINYISSGKTLTYAFEKAQENMPRIKLGLPNEIQLLYRVLYREIYNKRWDDVPLVLLSQAIITATDPYIVLESPSKATNHDVWPVDSELEALLQTNTVVRNQKFTDIICDGISPDEIILGGTLVTFTHDKEVCATYTSVVFENNDFFSKTEMYYTFNSRSYMFDLYDRYEPISNCLVHYNGGTSCFHNSSLLCCPNKIWGEVFDWKPVVNKDIFWVNNQGQKVVRFQYVYGKNRWMNNSYNSLQPIMQRWIAKKSEVDKLKNELGVMLKNHIEVVIQKNI